jgi:predicted MPP superfamily phosphohydrolase
MPRWLAFVIFFTLFITVWGSANYYVFRRGWQALREHSRLGQRRFRRAYVGLAVFLSTAYLAARMLDQFESICGRAPFAALAWIGSIWLGFAPYLLFICLGIDLVRLGNRWLGYFPAGWAEPDTRARVRLTTAALVLSVVSAAILAGYINAVTPAVRKLSITLDKPYKRDTLRIAMASDMHLGAIVGAGRLRDIVAAINVQQADLVLLPGDVVDEPLGLQSHPEICRLLKSLRSRLGVYGSTGNHEYIAGEEKTVPFLQACGVSLLRDRVVELDGGLYLAGREDVSRERMVEGGGRARLPDILSGIDRTRPLILMDHSPIRLQEAEQAGVDLQLSGHTHNAQLWPFQLITGLVYEQDWGYLRKGRTQYYVSCGAGTWGPPVRTNSRSEVVVIDLRFK